MNRSELREVLRRLQEDGDFLNDFQVSPEDALSDFDVSPEELAILSRRDDTALRLMAAMSEDAEEGGDDLLKTLAPFPELTLTPLPSPSPGGGGFQLHLPPLTLTLGQPPPPPPGPPFIDIFGPLPPPPPPPDPPIDPFPPVPPPPPPPPPPLPPLPDFPPPTPPMHPPPPEIFGFVFKFGDQGSEIPEELVAKVRATAGEDRQHAITRMLRIMDGRAR
jgi:hypothetical protein